MVVSIRHLLHNGADSRTALWNTLVIIYLNDPIHFLIISLTNIFMQASSSSDEKFCCKSQFPVNTNLTILVLMKKGLPKTLLCWGFLWPFPWRCRAFILFFSVKCTKQWMRPVKGKKSFGSVWKIEKLFSDLSHMVTFFLSSLEVVSGLSLQCRCYELLSSM